MIEKDYKSVWLARDKTGLLHAFHTKPFFDKQSGCWCRGDNPTEVQLRRRVGRSNDRIFVSLNDDEYPYIKDCECYEFKLVNKTE